MRRFLVPVLMLAGLSLAQENYSTNWTGHRTLHVNTANASPTGTSITANVLKYPMLVRLSAKDSAIFTAAKAGGVDIRFTKANNTTRLKHQIDTWDATGRNAAIWVLMDTVLANSLQTLRMANGFEAVWHLGDSTGLQLRANSVPGGNPATPKVLGTTAATGFAPKVGLIGWADSLRSQVGNTDTADHFTVGSGYQFAQGTGTISTWINMPAAGQGGDWNNFIALSSGTTIGGGLNQGGLTNNIWMGRQQNTNNFRFGTSYSFSTTVNGVEAPNRDIAQGLAPLGQWHHFTVSFDGTMGRSRKLYRNGVLTGSFPAGPTDTSSNIKPVLRTLTFIGRSAWGDRNLRGKVDEVRISKVARSADWVKLDWGSQNQAAMLVVDSTVPSIAYAPDSVNLTVGFAASPITISTLGGFPAPTVAISPALPAGLTLTTAVSGRGTISGTPTAASAKTKYVITASNTIGGTVQTATDSIWITVNAPSVAEDYSTWTGVKTLSFSSPATTTQTRFPFLLRLTSADAAAFTAGRASLRFSKTDGAKLPYSIDTWDAAGQKAAVWVLMDQVAPGSNSLRLHWGKAGATDQSAPSTVFDTTNGYVSVWHMGNPVGDTLRGVRPNSATPGVNEATPYYPSAPVASMIQDGAIGKADSVRGQGRSADGDHFHLGTGAAYGSNFPNGLSMSLWIKPTRYGGNGNFNQFMTLGNRSSGPCPPCAGAGSGTNSIWFGRIGNSNNFVGTEALNGGSSGGRLDGPNGSAALNVWHHYTVTLDGTVGSGQKIYRNGVLLNQRTNTATLQSVARTANFLARATWDDSTNAGVYDEARVSNVIRSADWVALEYASQQPGAAPVTLSYASITGTPGVAVTTSPTVTGTPIKYSITSGVLPSGLALDSNTGVISGTSAGPASATVTVTATSGVWSAAATTNINIASADGAYATAWTGHRFVNVNTSGVVTPNTARLVKFPLLVRLGTADSAIFNASQANGADIRFTKLDNTTRLQHEIDTWDKANKRAAVWVLIDTAYGNSSGSRLMMHFGNANVADSSKASAVFDSANYAAVFHLGGADGTVNRPNAVPGGNPATPANFQTGYAPSQGIIGLADSLGVAGNGASGSHLSFGPLPVGTVKAGKVTLSFWIKKSPHVGWRHAISIGSGAPNQNFWFGSADGAGSDLRLRTAEGTTEMTAVNVASFWLDDTWQNVQATFDASAVKVYGNGTQAGEGDIGHTLADVARTSAFIGRALWNDPKFLGVYDEVRVTKSTRTAPWVKLEYENQKPTSTVVTTSTTVQPIVVGLNASALMTSGPALGFKRFGQGLMFQVRSDVASKVRLSIIDLHGRVVWNHTAATSAGLNQVAWNGVSNNGQTIGSGVFAVRMSLLDENGKEAASLVRRVPLTR
jgi:hypothetical protein